MIPSGLRVWSAQAHVLTACVLRGVGVPLSA